MQVQVPMKPGNIPPNRERNVVRHWGTTTGTAMAGEHGAPAQSCAGHLVPQPSETLKQVRVIWQRCGLFQRGAAVFSQCRFPPPSPS